MFDDVAEHYLTWRVPLDREGLQLTGFGCAHDEVGGERSRRARARLQPGFSLLWPGSHFNSLCQLVLEGNSLRSDARLRPR